MYITHQKGEIARAKVELRAIEKGLFISRPAELGRYDLVIDDGEQLHRVQIKYCDCCTNGSVKVNLKKNSFNTTSVNKSRRYTKDEVDVIIVYVPSLEKFCWLGPDLFHDKTGVNLRYKEPKNGQKKKIIMVEDVEW